MKISIPIEVSARHLHISEQDKNKLFGQNYQLKKYKNISQTGQFATKESVKVIGPKKTFYTMRIVGPERPNSQVELSTTDCFYLGIKSVLKISGNTVGAQKLKIIGPKGSVNIPAIVAMRHIHISNVLAKKYGLKNKQRVRVKIPGVRGLILNNVVVRVHPTFVFRLHLDTDEANAAGVKNNSKGEVLIEK